MTSIGMFEMWILLVFFGGGPGTVLPTSLPPRAFDAELASMAPADCMFFYMQMGVAPPSETDASQTEKLLALPSVIRFREQAMAMAQAQLLQAAARGGADEANQRRLRDLLVHVRKSLASPFLLFLDFELSLNAFGSAPRPSGALVIRFDDDGAEKALATIRHILETEGAPLTSVATGHEVSADRLVLPGDVTIDLARVDKFLIVAMGEQTLDGLLTRRGGKPPAWMESMRKDLAVERPNMITTLRLGKWVDFAKSIGPFSNVLDELGIGNLRAYESVTGIGGERFVARQRLRFKGEIGGLLGTIGSEPLESSDLAGIPADAMAAVALKADPLKTARQFVTATSAMNFGFGGGPDLESEFDGFRERYGYDLRDDLLASLEGSAQFAVLANDKTGVPDVRLVLGIQARDKAAKVEASIVKQIQNEFEGRRMAPELTKTEHGGQTIYTVAAKVEPKEIPANWTSFHWCLTDRHFVISNSKRSVESFIDQPIAPSGLASRADVKAALEKKPFAIAYMATPKLMQSAYAALPRIAKVVEQLGKDRVPRLDVSSVPPAAEVLPLVQPTVFAAYRQRDAYYFEAAQTMPGLDLLAAGVMSSNLLASSARRIQTLSRRTKSTTRGRQLMLALFNYENDHQAFPPAYSVDETGKPLLSWRVHILPYLDEGDLYRQFHLDEPWDSEHNKKLIEKIPEVFTSVHDDAAEGTTVYLAIRTKDAVFAEPKTDDERQSARKGLGTRIADIRDGTSHTVVIVEVAGEHAVPWTKPDDLVVDPEHPEKALEKLLAQPNGRVLAVFCDGSVRMLPLELAPDDWLHLFQKSDGQSVDWDERP